MKEAWEEICGRHRIQVSIDLFSIGIVFIDPELKKTLYNLLLNHKNTFQLMKIYKDWRQR